MRFKNEMFDIVKSIENSTSITYYCINDKKEESLFVNLDEHITTHISANNPLKNNPAKKITDHVIKIYYSTEQRMLADQLCSSVQFPSLLLNYSSALLYTESPPPKFA
jgi:hypothetical protein